MSNTLFNDAALNVKVSLSSGGLQDNELAAQNTITIATSGGAGTTSNLAELLDVDDDPTVNNGILIYNSSNSTYTLTQIPNGAYIEFEFTAANNQTNFAGNDNNSASLNYRTADSIKVFLNDKLSVGEDTIIKKSLSVEENIILKGDLSVAGSNRMVSTLSVGGATTFGNALNISGHTHIESSLNHLNNCI